MPGALRIPGEAVSAVEGQHPACMMISLGHDFPEKNKGSTHALPPNSNFRVSCPLPAVTTLFNTLLTAAATPELVKATMSEENTVLDVAFIDDDDGGSSSRIVALGAC